MLGWPWWIPPYQSVCAPIWRPVGQSVWQPSAVSIGWISNPTGPIQIGSNVTLGGAAGGEVASGSQVTSNLGDFSSAVVGCSVVISGPGGGVGGVAGQSGATGLSPGLQATGAAGSQTGTVGPVGPV